MRRMAGVEEGGATMTTPVGRAHHTKCSYNLRARRTGFYHRVGAPITPTVRGSGLRLLEQEIQPVRLNVVRVGVDGRCAELGRDVQ
jgi:hypothetical protein